MVDTHERLPLIAVRPPDVYFTHAYGRACALASDAEWVLLETHGGCWQLPLLLRPTYGGHRDAISPHGYAGLYCCPALAADSAERAWVSSLDTLRGWGVVTVFLRHSPLVPQAPWHASQVRVIDGHPTVLVDLTGPEAMWARMAGRSRTAVRKSERVGITTQIATATIKPLRSGGTFRQLYDQSMASKQAPAEYVYPDRYYEALIEGLGDDLLLAEAVDPQGEVLASMLFLRHEGLLHYHLSASTPAGSRSGSNNALIWSVMAYASKRGLTALHLGGGQRANDSLLEFKKSFGGRLLTYGASGVVLDPKAYRTEIAIRADQLGVSPEKVEESSFFPAYRAPDHATANGPA